MKVEPLDFRELEEKFCGSLLGLALGDTLGELAFTARSRRRLEESLKSLDHLSYTDDTAMAIALAQSLLQEKDLHPQSLGKCFHEAYLQEPWRGYGPGPRRIFSLVTKTGLSYLEAAQKLYRGQGSLGNGAAMRIAPVSLFFLEHPELEAKARLSAAVTHAHPVGQDGAVVLARAVAEVIKLRPPTGLNKVGLITLLLTIAQTEEIREKLHQIIKLLEKEAGLKEAASLLGTSVIVQESMPYALYAFLSHPTNFKEALLAAILQGGDRDTIGAMTGALAGAYLGIKALPKEWLDKLENRDKIETLARKLGHQRQNYSSK